MNLLNKNEESDLPLIKRRRNIIVDDSDTDDEISDMGDKYSNNSMIGEERTEDLNIRASVNI